MWWIPILGGEFIMDRSFGYKDGLMGGNLWYFGKDTESALNAAEKGVEAILPIPNVITTFPGGIAGSGSKAGSDYDFTIASTFEKFCPLLQDHPEVEAALPQGVNSVMEIIMNGKDMESIIIATQAAIEASKNTDGLLMISAGNYDGKLGKSFIYLHPEKQPQL
jgi:formylmethanofuran--tetrahydromethanopterin N-formyltransferase